MSLSAVLEIFPLAIVEWTDLPSLEPARDAVEVKDVLTDAPSDCALFIGSWPLISLTLDALVHDVVPADRAVVHLNVPRPKSHRVPSLHFEPLADGRPLGLIAARYLHHLRLSLNLTTCLVSNCRNFTLLIITKRNKKGTATSVIVSAKTTSERRAKKRWKKGSERLDTT